MTRLCVLAAALALSGCVQSATPAQSTVGARFRVMNGVVDRVDDRERNVTCYAHSRGGIWCEHTKP